MSVTRPLVETLAQCIENVLDAPTYADKTLTQLLQDNPQWSLEERHYVVVNYYHIFRFKRLLSYLLEQEAIINDGFGYWLACQVVTQQPLPTWLDEQQYNVAHLQAALEQAPQAIRLSVPDWLDDMASAQLGDSWPVVAAALNKSAEQYLRVNTLKTDIEALKKSLFDEGIVVSQVDLGTHSALKVESNSHIFRSKAFQEGWFEMQDAGSQQIAHLLQPKAGQRVVDACAGAGGKSLHIASLMQNKGYVLAMDIHQHKLDALKTRAKRAGVHMLETRFIKNSKTIKRLKDKFDRVLLDVPCSGTGVLRRNPDAKWHLQSENIDNLVSLQAEILQRYSQMCKPGGRLVYATCSILPCENQQQVEQFLANNPQFKLVEELSLLPGISSEFDGFYGAALERLT